MFTGTFTSTTSASVAAASICIPRWPGGTAPAGSASQRSDAGSASSRQEHCAEPSHPDGAPPTEKPTTRPQDSPPPPPPATPAEQPAWMGSSAVPTSSAEVVSHFFPLGKSAKNNLICRTRQTRRRRCRRKIWNRSVNDLLGSRCWKPRTTKR